MSDLFPAPSHRSQHALPHRTATRFARKPSQRTVISRTSHFHWIRMRTQLHLVSPLQSEPALSIGHVK